MKNRLDKILKELQTDTKIPEPDENFKGRLYSTFPNSDYHFFRNKLVKVSLGFAAICVFIFTCIPFQNSGKDEWKPTKTIIIEDKMDPDYFKPTKVVTITEADQIK